MTDSQKINDSLKIAVEAIHFNDSSDYEEALWEIVKILGGEDSATLLYENSKKAYQLSQEGKLIKK